MADLSIIIISYNTAEITLKCLETVFLSLKGAPFKTEVIIVDNNSKDQSVSGIKKFQQIHRTTTFIVHLIESKENLGFAKGNNLAVKKMTGKYILFLNSDIEVIDDALIKLYNYFVSQNTFAFVGGKLLNKNGSNQASAAPFYSIPVIIGALFLRGDYLHITRYSPSRIRQVDWVSGACIITTKSAYEKVGGFDEAIFMYMDEVDLLYRARKEGLLTGFYPSARFIHLGSASSGGKTQPILQVYRGFLYFYKRHHGLLAQLSLKILLQLKAYIAYIIGKVTKNHYLISTYEQALAIVAQN